MSEFPVAQMVTVCHVGVKHSFFDREAQEEGASRGHYRNAMAQLQTTADETEAEMLQRILDRWEQKEAGEQASTNFR